MAFSGQENGEDSRMTKEDLVVKSSDMQDILIRYEFEHAPDADRRQDTSFCLANIFDQLQLEKK
jgi:hypothetical protein